ARRRIDPARAAAAHQGGRGRHNRNSLVHFGESPPANRVRPRTEGRQGTACGDLHDRLLLANGRPHPCGTTGLSTTRVARTPPHMSPESPPGAPPRPPVL